MQCSLAFSYSVLPALHNVLVNVAHTHRHGTCPPYVSILHLHSTYIYDLRVRQHVSTASVQHSISQLATSRGCTPAWWAREVPQAWPSCPQPASCALCSCLRTHYISAWCADLACKLMVLIMMCGMLHTIRVPSARSHPEADMQQSIKSGENQLGIRLLVMASELWRIWSRACMLLFSLKLQLYAPVWPYERALFCGSFSQSIL